MYRIDFFLHFFRKLTESLSSADYSRQRFGRIAEEGVDCLLSVIVHKVVLDGSLD